MKSLYGYELIIYIKIDSRVILDSPELNFLSVRLTPSLFLIGVLQKSSKGPALFFGYEMKFPFSVFRGLFCNCCALKRSKPILSKHLCGQQLFNLYPSDSWLSSVVNQEEGLSSQLLLTWFSHPYLKTALTKDMRNFK